MTTTLPTWAVWAISFGSPIAAVTGATFGPLLLRRGAMELEARSRRELLVKQMTWAAELAVDPDPRKAKLGVSHLADLADSELSDADTARFVRTTMATVIADVREQAEQAGDDLRIVRLDDVARSTVGLAPGQPAGLPSTEESTDEEVSDAD
ncbi:MAG: hypothetical protein JWO57_1139 [Pseudonocardiales bacterium]|nr:hypothetical protein [Pseudonocardiales bacterium]